MAWERYMEVTYNMVHVGQSTYSYNPHEFNNVIPVQLNSTDGLNNAEVAPPRNMSKIRGLSTKRGHRCIICHNDHFFDPSSDPNGNICWCDHGEVSHILYTNNEYSQKPSGNHSIATASAGTRRLRKNNNKTKRGLSKKSKKHKRRTRRRHKKN